MEQVERYNQIIDDVYKRYLTETMFHPEDNWLEELDGMDMSTGEIKKVYRQYVLKEFIHKCKNDPEFSQKWGLKIEERELTTVEERKKYDNYFDDLIGEYLEHHETLDKRGVPRKITTLTYNNETAITYE